MGKSGLKTFVYSFTFSLFAFVWAGKGVFSIQKNSENNIVIPNKNISLFFKDMNNDTSPTKSIPIKKIALSVPLTLSNDMTDDKTINPEKKSSEPISSEKQKDLIPLTFAENDIEFDVGEPETASAVTLDKADGLKHETTVQPQKIAQNYQEIISHKPDTSFVNESDEDIFYEQINEETFVNKPLQANVQILRPNAKNVQKIIQNSSENSAQDVKIDDNPQNIIPVQKDKVLPSVEEESHVIAMVPDVSEDASNKNINQNEDVLPPAFKVAEAKINPDNQIQKEVLFNKNSEVSVNEPKNLLIPLESNDYLSSLEKAKVTSSPEEDKLAMLNSKVSIHSMEQKLSENSLDESSQNDSDQWQTMAEKNNKATNKWIAAKGKGYIPNGKIKDEQFYKSADKENLKKVLRDDTETKNTHDSIKLVSETVDNLLIPIPEEILNDPNLTPQLVSSTQNKELEKKVTEQENLAYGTVDKNSSPKEKNSSEKNEDNNKGLLQSLTSIFKKTSDTTNKETEENRDNFLDRLKKKPKKNENIGKILPTEIRLAFQPNRAEISGVTLKWLQAFANKINEDKNAGLEIRIDGSSSYELQQKRLNLLNNILASNGVDFSKVNTVFTTREPNSFIIRTVRINNSNGGIVEDNDWQDYYKAW